MASNSEGRMTIHLPTVETYDKWAATYDTDGNILQALDSFALSRKFIPLLIDNLPQSKDDTTKELFITDLGCGTGRADLLLLSVLNTSENGMAEMLSSKGYKSILLTGIDPSTGMLDVAAGRVPKRSSMGDNLTVRVRYGIWDIHEPGNKIQLLQGQNGSNGTDMNIRRGDVVISTLVLEHLEIDPYFNGAKTLVQPGGLFLVTNMHSDMGNKVFGDPEQYKNQPLPTGAGFIDVASNTKFRAATDYAHTIEEVLTGASKAGFELVNNRVEELLVEPWMLTQSSPNHSNNGNSTPLLGSRGTKWVGTKCWYGMLFRLKG